MASNFGFRLTSAQGYEPETKALLVSFLKPGMVFVDLGANEGFFSVVASRLVGSGGKILAIEPQARLGSVIRRNLELNLAANVTLAQVAISAEAGVATSVSPQSMRERMSWPRNEPRGDTPVARSTARARPSSMPSVARADSIPISSVFARNVTRLRQPVSALRLTIYVR